MIFLQRSPSDKTSSADFSMSTLTKADWFCRFLTLVVHPTVQPPSAWAIIGWYRCLQSCADSCGPDPPRDPPIVPKPSAAGKTGAECHTADNNRSPMPRAWQKINDPRPRPDPDLRLSAEVGSGAMRCRVMAAIRQRAEQMASIFHQAISDHWPEWSRYCPARNMEWADVFFKS